MEFISYLPMRVSEFAAVDGYLNFGERAQRNNRFSEPIPPESMASALPCKASSGLHLWETKFSLFSGFYFLRTIDKNHEFSKD
jgi:hypothetical protein